MSEFSSRFWDLYIAVLTVAISIVACACSSSRRALRKAGAAGPPGHTWDEDLAEYNNPLPRWWSWLFYITDRVFGSPISCSIPGSASWRGTLGWSQVGQLEEESAASRRAAFGPLYDKFRRRTWSRRSPRSEGSAIGQKLFLNNCAQCHASDGGGSRGFPTSPTATGCGAAMRRRSRCITDGRTGRCRRSARRSASRA